MNARKVGRANSLGMHVPGSPRSSVGHCHDAAPLLTGPLWRFVGPPVRSVARYTTAATRLGLARGRPLTDEEVHQVAQCVQARPLMARSDEWNEVSQHRERIEHWLGGGGDTRPLRLSKVHTLLARDHGLRASYDTLWRYAHQELAWRDKPSTVRVDDAPPGQEAQVDFGKMVWLMDVETGRRRSLWALIVTRRRLHPKDSRENLENWLRKKAREDILRHLAVVTQKLRRTPNHVYVMGQRTKGGNCSALGNLSFNWRIVLAPDNIARYLVAHEVVQLAVPDHSPRFWLTLQSICPEVTRARQCSASTSINSGWIWRLCSAPVASSLLRLARPSRQTAYGSERIVGVKGSVLGHRTGARAFAYLPRCRRSPLFGTLDRPVQRRRRDPKLLRHVPKCHPLFAKRTREANVDRATGLPMCTPRRRARSIPALVRATSCARFCSATRRKSQRATDEPARPCRARARAR